MPSGESDREHVEWVEAPPLKAPLWSHRRLTVLPGNGSVTLSHLFFPSLKNMKWGTVNMDMRWILSRTHHEFDIYPKSHQGFEDWGQREKRKYHCVTPGGKWRKAEEVGIWYWEEKAEESAAFSHRGWRREEVSAWGRKPASRPKMKAGNCIGETEQQARWLLRSDNHTEVALCIWALFLVDT